jgi:hypothetical protein
MKTILLIILLLPIYGQRTNESFNDFFEQFATDKDFQFSRIRFPLAFTYYDTRYDTTATTVLKSTQWRYESFAINDKVWLWVFDNFNAVMIDSGERLVQWRGNRKKWLANYYFKRQGSRWYLVRKEELPLAKVKR